MDSTKLSVASSHLRWLNVNKPMFQEPSLLLSSGNWLPQIPVCLIYIPAPIPCSWLVASLWVLAGRVKCWLCFAMFLVSMSVTISQALFNIKPPSLLKLFAFCRISVASFMRQSIYSDVLSNIEVPMKWIWWPALMLCSAISEISTKFLKP